VNQQAAGDIASAIAREVPDRGYTVNVEFRGGVAVLRGSVSSPAQLHRVLKATRSRPQVQRVVNELQVATGDIKTVSFQAELPPPPAPAAQLPAEAEVGLGPATPEFTFPLGAAPQYDAPYLPPFAWPAYAPYPNISAVQYPLSYTTAQWPHMGPFHPYPEPPLDWRKVHAWTLAGLKPIRGEQDPPPEWHCFKLRWEDGHWYLSFRHAWWAKRGMLKHLFHPAPPECGTYACGYRLWFPQQVCNHMFMKD
jgi:hypothetical protein